MQVGMEKKRANFIYHKGKRILFLDFSDCSVEKSFKIIEESKKLIRTQQKSSLLNLMFVKNARYNTKLVDALKDWAAHNRPYMKKQAIVGIEGLQEIVYDAVTKFMRVSSPSFTEVKKARDSVPKFDDIEKAKDWLVE